MLESLFNKVAEVFWPAALLKGDFNIGVYSTLDILRTPILKDICKRLFN